MYENERKQIIRKSNTEDKGTAKREILYGTQGYVQYVLQCTNIYIYIYTKLLLCVAYSIIHLVWVIIG
jgi:hypothetical protein